MILVLKHSNIIQHPYTNIPARIGFAYCFSYERSRCGWLPVMCGIFFSWSLTASRPPSDDFVQCLSRRGPDSCRIIHRSLGVKGPERRTLCDQREKLAPSLDQVSTVLSLRGGHVVAQPLEDSNSGSLLSWNGEAWKIKDIIVQGNDAKLIFDHLLRAAQTSDDSNHTSKPSSRDTTLRNILNVFSWISGPYAFVFYDAQNDRVFYGRDILGRRSLLISKTPTTSLRISSVSAGKEVGDWIEVEADGIYMLDLTSSLNATRIPFEPHVGNSQQTNAVVHIPWANTGSLPQTLHSLVPDLHFHFRIHV